jgi:hypothetical protein
MYKHVKDYTYIVTDNESRGQPACQEEQKICKEEKHE